MQGDVEQAALSVLLDLRQAGDRLRGEPAVAADDAQPPGALGDQHAPVGQEGESPGVVEPLDDGDDAERLLVRLDDLRRGRGRGDERDGDRAADHQGVPPVGAAA